MKSFIRYSKKLFTLWEKHNTQGTPIHQHYGDGNTIDTYETMSNIAYLII
jgi:hypothetical protein